MSRIALTSAPGARFTVLASKNISLALTNWPMVGHPTEVPIHRANNLSQERDDHKLFSDDVTD